MLVMIVMGRTGRASHRTCGKRSDLVSLCTLYCIPMAFDEVGDPLAEDGSLDNDKGMIKL